MDKCNEQVGLRIEQKDSGFLQPELAQPRSRKLVTLEMIYRPKHWSHPLARQKRYHLMSSAFQMNDYSCTGCHAAVYSAAIATYRFDFLL